MNIIRPNPKVLKWARETAGYTLEEVVKKLDKKTITVEKFLAIEKGEEFLSYPQLESLAYKIYKRPLALFFFPDPPDENAIKKSFRTLPKPMENLSPKMRFLIRKARFMQMKSGRINKY